MTFEELQELAHREKTDNKRLQHTLLPEITSLLGYAALANIKSIAECGFYCGHSTIALLRAGYSVTSVDRNYDEYTKTLVSRIYNEYKNFTFIHDEWENVNISADMCFLDGDDVSESSFENYSWLVLDTSPKEPLLSNRWKLVSYTPKLSGQRLYINTRRVK